MDKCLGISDERLHHSLGVARECVSIAKFRGFNDQFCKKMFIIGFLHDIGYEFAVKQSQHADISGELLSLIGCSSDVINVIKNHGCYFSNASIEWVILNLADLTIDSNGNKVDIIKRLEGIKNKYGEYSNQYLTSCDIAVQIGLIDQNSVYRLQYGG